MTAVFDHLVLASWDLQTDSSEFNGVNLIIGLVCVMYKVLSSIILPILLILFVASAIDRGHYWG